MFSRMQSVTNDASDAFDVEIASIFVHNSSDILVRADLQGVILSISSACSSWGWEPNELIGRQAISLVHPHDVLKFQANMDQLARGQRIDRAEDREFRYLRKDGGWVWLQGNPQVVHRGHGSVEIINIFRDVTDRRALQEHRTDLERLEKLANATLGLGFWRLDASSKAITWSEQMFNVYGLPAAADPPLAVAMAMIHPDDQADANERVAKALETGVGWSNGLTRLVRPDGEVRFVEGRGFCELDESGAVASVVGTMVDITDRKRAEMALAQSEARFRRMTENAPDMIAECGLDGVMTYVSPASLAITGFTPEELVGRTAASLHHPEDSHKIYEMCQTVMASRGAIEPWPVEFRATHKDGHEIWLECKPVLSVDPSTGLFNGINDVIRDITEHKALEHRLLQAQAEAEGAAAVKSEFLANMSHEIRTPLTAILGFTRLLADRPSLDDVARSHLHKVETASRALHSLVNDVLDFSKLEAGQVDFTPQPNQPVEFAHDTLVMFSPQANAKGLSLEFIEEGDLPEWLAFDQDRLRQILLNLIGNAVKFTSEGSIRLRLRYEPAREMLCLAIEDTGPGMAPEDQAKLFQRFAQVDGSTTRKYGGTGLGLAISKGLAEAMGGQIGVESTLGKGSVFSFCIAAPPAHPPATPDEIAPVTLEGVRVLVVDDNPVNREVARALLEQFGAEVTLAAGGVEALDVASTLPFDVVLLDYRMPEMDGPETLRRLRGNVGPNRHIPVLGFSADVGVASPPQGGFDDFVAKPIDAAVLIDKVLTWTTWTHIRPSRSKRQTPFRLSGTV